MNIEWNKVTWYSKVLAVVLFVLTFYIGFHLGSRSREEKGNIDMRNEVPEKQISNTVIPISISTENIKEENFSGTVPKISGSGAVALAARTYSEDTVAKFRRSANEQVPDMRAEFGEDSPIANYEINIDATYVKGLKTESIVISVYTYTGGAHGSTLYKVITGSLPYGETSSRILELSDIVKQNSRTSFTEFVKKELRSWRPDGTGISPLFEDDVNDLQFSSFANWSLDNKNLIIYFDQYQIGPGVLGGVAFPLSLDKVKNFIEPTYY